MGLECLDLMSLLHVLRFEDKPLPALYLQSETNDKKVKSYTMQEKYNVVRSPFPFFAKGATLEGQLEPVGAVPGFCGVRHQCAQQCRDFHQWA